jgi:hypothetical protein
LSAPKVNKAFFQAPDFAKPLVISCLIKPFFGVGSYVLDSVCRGCGIHLKETALNAGTFMNAWDRLRTVTAAQRDPPQEETLFELCPFGFCCRT